jgi:hypothetical protein
MSDLLNVSIEQRGPRGVRATNGSTILGRHVYIVGVIQWREKL